MKKLLFLFLGLLVGAGILTAQEPLGPGRYQSVAIASGVTITNASEGTVYPASGQSFFNYVQSSSAIAEAITPEIQALAANLGNNPTNIFNFVHDQIRYLYYFGSKKGAELTLLERSGNDFDQCALLSALLQAAGYSPQYQFGIMKMPYDSVNHVDFHHWLGLQLQDTNWANTFNYFENLSGHRGYALVFDLGTSNLLALQRVWVTLVLGGVTNYLDPSFKVSEPIAGSNLASATGVSASGLFTAAGGTDTGTYVSGLNESLVRSNLQNYNSNLLAYLSNNAPNATVQQIIGGQQIVSSIGLPLSTSSLFPVTTAGGSYPLQTWNTQPTNFMSAFKISLGGTNKFWYTPQLEGQRVSLTLSNGLAQLWLEDALVWQTTNTGSSNSVAGIMSVTHPYGGWDNVNQVPIDTITNGVDQSITNDYQRTNASYAIMYGFDVNAKWLQGRQQKLDAYQQQGLPSSSRQVTTETLNVMGLSWLVQTELVLDLTAQEWGQLPQTHHRWGRMAQEAGRGYYVDVAMQVEGTYPATGCNAPDIQSNNQVFDVTFYFASAMEHGVIEQLQTSNLVAASTVKMLGVANNLSQPIYMASSANWTTGANVRGSLLNYGANLTTLDGYISGGSTLLLPQNGSNNVAGTATWAGSGYVSLLTNGFRNIAMLITGGYNGGFVSNPDATVNAPYVAQSGDAQPGQINPAPASTPPALRADPVNMLDGTFQLSATPDLSVGQADPRGITLSRYYSTELRNNNLAGMANGWLHNYYFNLAQVSAPQSGLGATTPQQMAPMIAATFAALNLYTNTSPDPKNWTITALIAKWGIDQLIKNAVSISMGKDTIQFLKQPDGSFTPPSGMAATLTNTGSGYNLTQRHGNTFQFGTNGLLNKIVDQYGRSLSLTYNASNWVSTIADWTNRSLTFTYSGTPSSLTSLTDSTGRTVSYGYTTNVNGQLDLTLYVDPQGASNSFAYDTNHEVIATFDPLGRLVVSNNYDGFGHVTTQYTQGDTNKLWQVFSSGFQTTVIDPAGGQQEYFYDSKSRQTGFQDALGNVSQTFYDGQDHPVMTVSPLNETNQFFYDANNNLTESIDPLGYSNTFVYDASFNLIRQVDARGGANTFGYNSRFQMTTATNAAGDATTNTYDAGTGLLTARSDAGGATAYGYDSYGQLNSIIYPGGLGTNLLGNNALGDVTASTNQRGFATTFQYNLRRQLTNTVAPTNLTVSAAYDAVGNVSITKDPRGFSTTNTWTPTRHLLATFLPLTPQGAPVITNGFDARDWLSVTVDPLQHPTTNSFDLAGRLAGVTDPLLRTSAMTYDNDGRRLTVTNAAQEGISQQWSVRGQLMNTVDQMGKSISKGYDPAGNLIFLTNRNGKVWQFKFDAANRLTNTSSPLSHAIGRSFNHRGLLQGTTDAMNQNTAFAYDARGRLTNRTDSVGATAYIYDFNGNLATNSENGQSLVRQFDAYDRLTSYMDGAGNVVQYHYDANGNLSSLTYPGNRIVTYSYDSLNRLTNVTDWASRQTSYTYDLASRLTSITRPNGTTRSNFYDAAGQLTNIIEQAGSHSPIAFFKLNWNSAARVQWEFMAPTNLPYSLPSRTLSYDADNRLTNFNGSVIANDNNGNMTSGPLTNGTPITYTFDARNRLLNVGGTGYIYDTANNRVALTNSSTSNIFVVDAKSSQVLMRIKSGVTNYYVYGVGLLYEEDDTGTSSNTLTYHFDSRGSTVALTDGNGNVTDRIQYSAYGMVTARIGTNDTPFQYNGRYGVQTDPNGLLYMRARYYNPYICRFINADPSGFSGGLNYYAYANGNPISMTDPFGLGAVGDSTGGGWFNNAAAGMVNAVNTVTYDVGAVTLGTVGLIGQAQEGLLNVVGLTSDDVIALGPIGGEIEGEIGLLKGIGALTEGAETGTQLEFPFVSELSGKPAIQWPANGGFAGTSASATLVPGTTIDRFGIASGSYVSPTGTPFIQRSLAPGTQYAPYNVYSVLQPIEVQAGPIAPTFGMPGGGIQFKLPLPVQSLMDSGHLGVGN